MSIKRNLNETDATKECYRIFASSSSDMPKQFINFRYRNIVNFEEFSALCKDEKKLYKNTLKVIEYLNTHPDMLIPNSEKDSFLQWSKEFDGRNIYRLWSLDINNMFFPLHEYLCLLLQPLLKANIEYFVEALKKINNIPHLNLILNIFLHLQNLI